MPLVALLLAACQAVPAVVQPTAAPPTTPLATPTPIAAITSPPATPPTTPTTVPPTPSPTASLQPSASPSQAPVTPTAPPTASPTAAPTLGLGTAPTGPTQEALVSRVVDGDTIVVRVGGTEHRVRYIGVDTPETVHPSRPVEWMGREASDANRRMVEGKRVVLEKDISETDRYGRLLRYVWLSEGGGWLLVNLEMLRRGLAQVSTYPPDVKYVDLYLDAQREAREAGRGLWGDPLTTLKPNRTPRPGGGGAGGRACDPAYPTVCIPPSPPDLDCPDIPYRRFKVLPPDPHRFDGDGDGVGCESG